MKIAYFGTPYFAADLLEQIIADPSLNLKVAFVVTQPDKPVGKKQLLTPSPVKLVAQKNNIPVFDNLADIKSRLEEVDLAVVYAYGFRQLIPLELLKAPKMRFEIGEGNWSGFINIHPSLLPRYRGSSPIAFPIFLSDELTGVSLFIMDEKMDHGPLVAQEKVKIALNDVRTDMEKKLTGIAFGMLKSLFTSKKISQLKPIGQNHSLTTHAHYMTKEHGFLDFTTLQKALKNEPLSFQELPHIIRSYMQKYKQGPDLNKPAKAVYDFWRGMHPWPGVWTTVLIKDDKKRLKIIQLSYDGKALQIKKVQLEGKNEVDFPTFQKAYGVL